VLQEVVLQRVAVGGQCVGLAFPGQAADSFQAASGELVEVAWHAAAGYGGQAGDVLVGTALALEPQDFELVLDARMRVVIAVVANGGEDFWRKREAAHGLLQCS
jgi:hypothetical protein